MPAKNDRLIAHFVATMPARDLVRDKTAERLADPRAKSEDGPLLRREGFAASDANVGRTITHLVQRGAIEPVPLLRRRKGTAARQWRRKHARRLPKGQKAKQPGEIVQVDTLSINIRPDKAVKHFTAYAPVARFTAARAVSAATARCAASFLHKLINAIPFRVMGIQIDGGSEFMAEFEDACQANNLALFVPPPKRPDLNGAGERAQSTWHYERLKPATISRTAWKA